MSSLPKENHEDLLLANGSAKLNLTNLDFSSVLLSTENFLHVDELLSKARKASAVFTQYNQEKVDQIVYAVVRAALAHSKDFAKLAVEETKMCLYEDKILKNMVASELLYNQIKDKKTVGVISDIKEEQIVLEAEPIGVIAALTPVTNPTSTVIYKLPYL